MVPNLARDTILLTRALYGDANLDGRVDFADLVTLAAHYGKSSGANWDQGDFNNDAKVTFADLVALAANYSGGTIAPAPTPLSGLSVVPLAGRRQIRARAVP